MPSYHGASTYDSAAPEWRSGFAAAALPRDPSAPTTTMLEWSAAFGVRNRRLRCELSHELMVCGARLERLDPWPDWQKVMSPDDYVV